MKNLLVVAIMALVTLAGAAIASPVETFQFRNDVDRIRFQDLTKELRCPKCQNQNLADSNSLQAGDLRREIYQMIYDGKSDTEIVNFMVYRYGDFVLYRPKVNATTYVLWFGPLAFVLLGAGVLVILLRRRPKKDEDLQAPLTEDQQAQLKNVLKD